MNKAPGLVRLRLVRLPLVSRWLVLRHGDSCDLVSVPSERLAAAEMAYSL
jgi:hypothetical protein